MTSRNITPHQNSYIYVHIQPITYKNSLANAEMGIPFKNISAVCFIFTFKVAKKLKLHANARSNQYSVYMTLLYNYLLISWEICCDIDLKIVIDRGDELKIVYINLFRIQYETSVTYNLPAEMAHSFLIFMITQFAGSVQFQSKIDLILRKIMI